MFYSLLFWIFWRWCWWEFNEREIWFSFSYINESKSIWIFLKFPNIHWLWSSQICDEGSCCSKWIVIFPSSNSSIYAGWRWKIWESNRWSLFIFSHFTYSKFECKLEVWVWLFGDVLSHRPPSVDSFGPPYYDLLC